MTIEEIAERVAERTGLRLYPRSIERILQALLRHTDFWDVVDASDEVVPLVAETVRILREIGWVRYEGDVIHLTETARQTIERLWGLEPLPDFRCSRCAARTLDLQTLPQTVVEQFYEIQRERPQAIIDYDQGYITPECTLARVAFAWMRGDIQGKRVLVLGDDDLVSIAICLISQPREVHVVEIDERLVSFIMTWARRMGWPLETHRLDLSQPLPRSFRQAFDTFLTDPPESVPAFRAFVGRGIAALRAPGGAGYFGFTRREASLFKWADIERYLIEQGVVITDILHNFHEYVNWDYAPQTRAWRLTPVKVLPKRAWYRSALFRIEALPEWRGEVDTAFEVTTFNDAEASTT